MSVYINDNVNYLYDAIESIYYLQIKKPDQVVIVCDGIILDGHQKVLNYWKNRFPTIFKIVNLPTNLGLPSALNFGITFCEYDYVARMDADDISACDRFYHQINYLDNNQDVTIVGSNVYEFTNNIKNIVNHKHVPIDPDLISRYIKFRNPLNHMSVIFKKDDVLKVGGYPLIQGYEDYFLWVKLYKNGYKIRNINLFLVYARIENNFLARRSGMKYFQNEIILQINFYVLKLFGFRIFLFNIFFRSFLRLIPRSFLQIVYKFLRRD